MTKKQKAEFAITCSEIRYWVLNHLKERVKSYGHWCPQDLFEVPPPIKFKFVTDSNTKQLNIWLSSSKHLYNSDGAIALMNALFDYNMSS